MAPAVKIFSLFIILAGFLLVTNLLTPQKSQTRMIINGQPIFVEIVDTPEKIVQGLSGREKLENNRGLLFVFDKVVNYPFWMKDMKFGLDFVFIRNQTVVDLAENIPYPALGQKPQTVNAGQPFDQVLEINAGQIKKLGIKVGDIIQIQ